MVTHIAVISLFMIFMAGIGIYFSRRQKSTEEYFVAGRSIPGWAMGLSMFATLVSSVSFIAYPAAGYEGKWWASVLPVFSAPLSLVVILWVLIPMYRDVVSISIYQYIELRFDRVTRIYSSITFFLLNLAKAAFVFYLVALTVNAIVPLDVRTVILVVGLITIFYTMLGGLEAVIWTDVIQGIILWVGGFIALAYTLLLPEEGPGEVLRVAWENSRFDFGSVEPTISQPTVWMLVAVGLLEGLQKSAADQTIVQRFIMVKTTQGASRGAIFSTVMTILSAILFTLIGSCLWAFYSLRGESLATNGLGKPEEVFPYFLDTQIPTVLAAVVLAAVLSAAMSTVSSSLNGFAAVGVEDGFRLLFPRSTDRQCLAVGKALAGLSGLMCIGLALVLIRSEGTAIELWYVIGSIVSAGIVGLFFLALMSKRANTQGVYAGIVTAIAFTTWATLTIDMDMKSATHKTFDLGLLETPIHGYMIGILSSLLFVVVGYTTSLLFPDNRPEIVELTYWGWLEKRRREASARLPGTDIETE